MVSADAGGDRDRPSVAVQPDGGDGCTDSLQASLRIHALAQDPQAYELLDAERLVQIVGGAPLEKAREGALPG